MTIESFNEKTQSLVREISLKRATILEEFAKAYLAHLNVPADFDIAKLEMVEQWTNDRLSVRWYFRVKEDNHEEPTE